MAQGNDSMTIIRTTASAGAVLVAVMATVPAVSQAQAPKAPLQLVPGPDQAKPTTRVDATKRIGATKPAKVTTNNKSFASKTASNKAPQTSASSKNARQAIAARQAAPKAARANSKQASRPVAARQPRPSQEPPTLPVLAARIFAQGDDPAVDNVMRDGDSISLIARLPWWRNDRMQDVQYGSVEAEDAVMAAAAIWIAANHGDGEPAADRAPGQRVTLASPEEAIEVADTGALNEIDLAASEGLPPPTPTFLQSLMALIGGIAAAAAATARALFV
jgi:hypothetical protein